MVTLLLMIHIIPYILLDKSFKWRIIVISKDSIKANQLKGWGAKLWV